MDTAYPQPSRTSSSVRIISNTTHQGFVLSQPPSRASSSASRHRRTYSEPQSLEFDDDIDVYTARREGLDDASGYVGRGRDSTTHLTDSKINHLDSNQGRKDSASWWKRHRRAISFSSTTNPTPPASSSYKIQDEEDWRRLASRSPLSDLSSPGYPPQEPYRRDPIPDVHRLRPAQNGYLVDARVGALRQASGTGHGQNRRSHQRRRSDTAAQDAYTARTNAYLHSTSNSTQPPLKLPTNKEKFSSMSTFRGQGNTKFTFGKSSTSFGGTGATQKNGLSTKRSEYIAAEEVVTSGRDRFIKDMVGLNNTTSSNTFPRITPVHIRRASLGASFTTHTSVGGNVMTAPQPVPPISSKMAWADYVMGSNSINNGRQFHEEEEMELTDGYANESDCSPPKSQCSQKIYFESNSLPILDTSNGMDALINVPMRQRRKWQGASIQPKIPGQSLMQPFSRLETIPSPGWDRAFSPSLEEVISLDGSERAYSPGTPRRTVHRRAKSDPSSQESLPGSPTKQDFTKQTTQWVDEFIFASATQHMRVDGRTSHDSGSVKRDGSLLSDVGDKRSSFDVQSNLYDMEAFSMELREHYASEDDELQESLQVPKVKHGIAHSRKGSSESKSSFKSITSKLGFDAPKSSSTISMAMSSARTDQSTGPWTPLSAKFEGSFLHRLLNRRSSLSEENEPRTPTSAKTVDGNSREVLALTNDDSFKDELISSDRIMQRRGSLSAIFSSTSRLAKQSNAKHASRLHAFVLGSSVQKISDEEEDHSDTSENCVGFTDAERYDLYAKGGQRRRWSVAHLVDRLKVCFCFV